MSYFRWNKSANQAIIFGIISLVAGVGLVILPFGIFLKLKAKGYRRQLNDMGYFLDYLPEYGQTAFRKFEDWELEEY